MNDPACWSWPVAEQYRRDVEEFSEADAFQIWHDGLCAICGENRPPFVLDHDHETGLERGYLCRSCNVIEGTGGGPRFAKYRDRHPAAILGYRATYVNAFGVTPLRPRSSEEAMAAAIDSLPTFAEMDAEDA